MTFVFTPLQTGGITITLSGENRPSNGDGDDKEKKKGNESKGG